MHLIAMTTAAKVIMVWIVLIGIFFAAMYYSKRFCFIHWTWKDLRAYRSEDHTMYCSICVQEAMNPNIKCTCGWKGKLHQLIPSQDEAEKVLYSCPRCDKKIKI